jgi:hypothetical protein
MKGSLAILHLLYLGATDEVGPYEAFRYFGVT